MAESHLGIYSMLIQPHINNCIPIIIIFIPSFLVGNGAHIWAHEMGIQTLPPEQLISSMYKRKFLLILDKHRSLFIKHSDNLFQ